MNQTYITLFIELAHAAEIAAERVLEYDKEHGDLQGYSAAKTMRTDFGALYDKIRDKDFDANTLTKQDYAKLMLGAIIVSEHIEKTIENNKKALQGYKIDTIPKLGRVVDCATDEEALALANEIFND